MIVLYSIFDSIAKKTSCFHYFSHGASLHHCSFSRMIFTLVYTNLAYVLSTRKALKYINTSLSVRPYIKVVFVFCNIYLYIIGRQKSPVFIYNYL